jgi:hypothetical protein
LLLRLSKEERSASGLKKNKKSKKGGGKNKYNGKNRGTMVTGAIWKVHR